MQIQVGNRSWAEIIFLGARLTRAGTEVFLYASGQPFTHGGDAANQTWENNTGIFRGSV